MALSQQDITRLGSYFLAKGGGALQGDVHPGDDASYDLGRSDKKWDTVYAVTVIADNIQSGSGVGDADTVDGFHAAQNPLAGLLLALDESSVFPTGVYNQALLKDGSRALEGSMTVVADATIDGVDIGDHTHTGVGAMGPQLTHANLLGLDADDHLQYAERAQDETITGDWMFTHLVDRSAGWIFLPDDHIFKSIPHNLVLLADENEASIGIGAYQSSEYAIFLYDDDTPTTYVKVGRGDDSVTLSGTDSTYRIWAGNAVPGSAPFRVEKDGSIYAIDGEIAGWTIDSTSISKNDMVLHSTGYIAAGTGDNLVRIDSQDATWRLWAGNATAGDAPFRVNKTGDLYIGSGYVSGVLRSTNFISGQAGFSLNSSGLAEFDNIIARGRLQATVFAEAAIAVASGKLIVSDGSVLAEDMEDTDDYFVVDAPVFLQSDIVRLKPDASRDEWMRITSPYTVEGDNYKYYVVRELNSGEGGYAGPYDFYAGESIVRMGSAAQVNIVHPLASGEEGGEYGEYQPGGSGSTTGGGFLILEGSRQFGPYFGVAARYGPVYDQLLDVVRIGNLDGILDYTTEEWGAFFGDSNAFMAYDQTQGLRIEFSGTGVDTTIDDTGIATETISIAKVTAPGSSVDPFGFLYHDTSDNLLYWKYGATSYNLTAAGGGGPHILATSGPHTGELPWADMAAGTQGSIVRRGASDWEEYALGTQDYVLKAGATDVAWGQIAFSELTGDIAYTQLDSLVDTVGGGSANMISAAGHVHTDADGSTKVDHGDLSGTSIDQHHNRDHDIEGSTHTASGLTIGHVMRASGAAAFSFAALIASDIPTLDHGSDLSGLDDDDHGAIYPGLNQTESITGAWTFDTAAPTFDIQQKIKGIMSPGAGVSGYGHLFAKTDGKLYWHYFGGAQLDLTAGVTDHGALGGLDDDDHGAIYPGLTQSETISGTWTYSIAPEFKAQAYWMNENDVTDYLEINAQNTGAAHDIKAYFNSALKGYIQFQSDGDVYVQGDGNIHLTPTGNTHIESILRIENPSDVTDYVTIVASTATAGIAYYQNASPGASITLGVSFVQIDKELDLDGDLDFQGPQTIKSTSGNIAFNPAGLLTFSKGLSASWDAGGFEIRSSTFQSDVPTTTPPFIVASTTKVTNLNVDLLDDQSGAYYLDSANFTGTDWDDLTDSGETSLHSHAAGAPQAHVLATSGPHTGTLPLTDLAVGTRGSIIRRGAADWEEYALGTTNYVLKAGATDVAWGQVAFSELTGDIVYTQLDSLVDVTGGGSANLISGAQHVHTDADGSTKVTYSNLSGIPSTFTPAAHDIEGAAHTASGLTIGHVMRASGAAAFSFAALQAGDIPALAYADDTESFVVMALSGGLSNERRLQGTANQITLTDGGVGADAVLSLPATLIWDSTSLTLQTTTSGDIILDAFSNIIRIGGAGVGKPYLDNPTAGAFAMGSGTTDGDYVLIASYGHFYIDFQNDNTGVDEIKVRDSGDVEVWTLDSDGNMLVAGVSTFQDETIHDVQLQLKGIAAPGAGPSGYGHFYAKTDGKLYFHYFGGTEYDLTAGGLWSDQTTYLRPADSTDGLVIGAATAPDGLVHIFEGSAGAVDADGGADTFVLEMSGDGGLSFLKPDANWGQFVFGSPSQAKDSWFSSNYSLGRLDFVAASHLKFDLRNTSGTMVWNENSYDVNMRWESANIDDIIAIDGGADQVIFGGQSISKGTGYGVGAQTQTGGHAKVNDMVGLSIGNVETSDVAMNLGYLDYTDGGFHAIFSMISTGAYFDKATAAWVDESATYGALYYTQQVDDTVGGNAHYFYYEHASGTAWHELMRLVEDGGAVFNANGTSTHDFRVQTSGLDDAIFIDSGDDFVGFGLQSSPMGTDQWAFGTEDDYGNFQFYNWDATPLFGINAIVAGGTEASPSATPSGSFVGFGLRGWETTNAYGGITPAYIGFVTTEAFTGTTKGTKAYIRTTEAGTTARYENVLWDGLTTTHNPDNVDMDYIMQGDTEKVFHMDAGVHAIILGPKTTNIFPDGTEARLMSFSDGTTPSYAFGSVTEAASNIFQMLSTGSSGSLGAGYLARYARGTFASPTQTQSGDRLGFFLFGGVDNSSNWVNAAGFISYTTQAYTATARGTKFQILATLDGVASRSVQVEVQAGVIVGAPTGSFKGTGSINVDDDYYKDGTSITADYVLEHYYKGDVVDFINNPGAQEYKGLPPIDVTREFMEANLRLPWVEKTTERTGLYASSQMLLVGQESLMLYVLQLEERIRELEAAVLH